MGRNRRLTVGRRAALGLALSVLAPIAVMLLVSLQPSDHAGQTALGYRGASSTTREPTARRTHAAHSTPRTLTPDETLAAALSRSLPHQMNHLAVGVVDLTTGVTATFRDRQRFDTASIVKADILAVLLLQHQQLGTSLSADEQELATEMITASDNKAANDLWDDVEGAYGIEAGNAVLGLHGTNPDPSAWGLTTTTVTDQLRLLADLTSARSPLTASSRRYELGLMRSVVNWQDWGVSAAADGGTRPAIKNGWLPLGPDGPWEINSIGVISHARHEILIAVLSSGYPSELAGIRLVQAAASAAASAITNLR